MPLTENLDWFLSSDEFATAATYNSTTVYVILDKEYFEEGGISGFQPIAHGKASDFSAATPGTSTITINSVAYVIQEIHNDGQGFTSLILEEQ